MAITNIMTAIAKITTAQTQYSTPEDAACEGSVVAGSSASLTI